MESKSTNSTRLDLSIAWGVADKALAIRGGVPQGGEELPVVELEDPALKSAREFLKLKSAKTVEQKVTEKANL